MIVLFTDFGVVDPYIGQMQAAIYRHAPSVPVVNLFANVPCFNSHAAAYLLPAYVSDFPLDAVFLCVVDPGVGSSDRRPIVATVDGRTFVGPENGLFDVLAARAEHASKQEIVWVPERLSNSFHGRDLFSPVAAKLAIGSLSDGCLGPVEAYDVENVPEELDEAIYIDRFGNVMTGRRASTLGDESHIQIGGVQLSRARTFSDVPQGKAFWYENANGLVEFAVNCGSAAQKLGITPGDQFTVLL